MPTNTLLTPSMITLEALPSLVNNCVMPNLVSRKYDDRFARDGMKIGDTLQVRLPPRYKTRLGAAVALQGITQTSVPIVIDKQRGVDLEISDRDFMLSIERFREDIIGPATVAIGNDVDVDLCTLASQIPSFVGTPGTLPATSTTYLQAPAALANQGAPVDDKIYCVINPNMNVAIVAGLQGLFNDQTTLSAQYTKGRMGKGLALGMNWYMDQNVYMHQIGAYAGTPISTAATTQTGASITTTGWTSGQLSAKKGDIVAFAGTYAINPLSKQSTGALKQFVLTADVTDTTGSATLSISPSIDADPNSPTQNVSAAVAGSSAVYVWGVTGNTALTALPTVPVPQGLAFHQDAFTLVMVKPPTHNGLDMSASIADDVTGVSMRFQKGYDIRGDQSISRLDVYYGFALIRPEYAVRVTG